MTEWTPEAKAMLACLLRENLRALRDAGPDGLVLCFTTRTDPTKELHFIAEARFGFATVEDRGLADESPNWRWWCYRITDRGRATLAAMETDGDEWKVLIDAHLPLAEQEHIAGSVRRCLAAMKEHPYS